jgi:hypothetical protein
MRADESITDAVAAASVAAGSPVADEIVQEGTISPQGESTDADATTPQGLAATASASPTQVGIAAAAPAVGVRSCGSTDVRLKHVGGANYDPNAAASSTQVETKGKGAAPS